MADVVLTQSNHLFHDRKQVEKMQPYPPLQTVLAASVLREASISIALCDVTFDPPAQALEQVLDACLPRLPVICEDDFNFLSKMCLSGSRMLSFEMAKAAKESGILVAAHGCDSSAHPAAYLQAGFDYVLIEVESTLLELAQGRAPETIAGPACRGQDGMPRHTQPRMLRSEIESLPHPARDLVNMNPYHDAWRSAHGCFHRTWCPAAAVPITVTGAPSRSGETRTTSARRA
jgi:anaerobic magnesium-protoporphyrin IX monomethyl ester cyclase